jgi:superfamily II DNA or RNA helicase
MIIFDEVYLVSDTATTLRKVLAADPKKPLLGLTATIDEQDPRYNTILSLLPPVSYFPIILEVFSLLIIVICSRG